MLFWQGQSLFSVMHSLCALLFAFLLVRTAYPCLSIRLGKPLLIEWSVLRVSLSPAPVFSEPKPRPVALSSFQGKVCNLWTPPLLYQSLFSTATRLSLSTLVYPSLSTQHHLQQPFNRVRDNPDARFDIAIVIKNLQNWHDVPVYCGLQTQIGVRSSLPDARCISHAAPFLQRIAATACSHGVTRGSTPNSIMEISNFALPSPINVSTKFSFSISSKVIDVRLLPLPFGIGICGFCKKKYIHGFYRRTSYSTVVLFLDTSAFKILNLWKFITWVRNFSVTLE